MSDQRSAAVQSIDQATKRLIWALGHVPDDRLEWSPAPTAKNALQIVGHIIESNAFFASALAEAASREAAAGDAGEVVGRQDATDRLNATADALMDAIKALPYDRLDATIPTPMGDI